MNWEHELTTQIPHHRARFRLGWSRWFHRGHASLLNRVVWSAENRSRSVTQARVLRWL